jgi:hypothetical protein
MSGSEAFHISDYAFKFIGAIGSKYHVNVVRHNAPSAN